VTGFEAIRTQKPPALDWPRMAEDSPPTPDGGVLGKLPHSRPGRRSEKRAAGRPAEAAGAAAEKAEAVDSAAAKPPKPRTRPRQGAGTRTRRAAPPPRREPPPEPASRGPVEQAVRGVGKVAGAGLQVAGGVAKGIVRRIPRP
jgi:hypothetical protein